MNVEAVMTPDPVTIQAQDTIRNASRIIRENKIGGLPVLDGTNLIGMITESDILALLRVEGPSEDLWLPSPLEVIEIPIREFFNWEKTKDALSDIGSRPVRSHMSYPIITIDADDTIEEAARIMLREGIARLPVTRDAQLAGIVTRADIIEGIGRKKEEESG
ncbi:MAG: CBS domain-containing protein [Methanocalculus sp. MSAO_Arc1]|uniref:CBS domain-containing protein n=1 Tax=Methanocalculus TaxID=71151 RepID=UPI000FF8568A|nr:MULTISPECIES: CBS domain-containing protein [unclassified Methanocalculus]MCP1661475.1 CBS domain-containing protein [Methanocalculus sp. AMF5]RQD79751.1 MAG: CBS domain-containing protein [Methanocalculus sp. MSAO_Arc1]